MSKEMQLQLGKALVQAYGLKLVKVYIDEKTSGFRKPLKKRSGISELLDDASKGLFKVVITMTGDRLARNPFDMITIREVLDFNKIHLVYSMSGAIQPHEQDIVTEMISYSTAMSDSVGLSSKARAVGETKSEKGEWNGGSLSFGFRLNINKGIIEFLPEAKQVIIMIYGMYISGMSFDKIASTLDPATNPTGRWTKSQIEGIIKNPIYCGYLTWGKRTSHNNSSWRNPSKWEMVESKHIPKIIDKEKWDLAQSILTQKRSGCVDKKFYSTPYILRGLLYCQCGCRMITKDNRSSSISKEGVKKTYGNQIYTCPNKCLQILKDDIDDFIIGDLKTIIIFSLRDQLLLKIEENIKNQLEEGLNAEKKLQKRLEYYKKKIKRFYQLTEKVSSSDCEDGEINCYRDIINDSEASLKKIELIIADNKIDINEKKALLEKKEEWFNNILDFPSSNKMSSEEIRIVVNKFYKKIILNSKGYVTLFYQPGFKKQKQYIYQSKINWPKEAM